MDEHRHTPPIIRIYIELLNLAAADAVAAPARMTPSGTFWGGIEFAGRSNWIAKTYSISAKPIGELVFKNQSYDQPWFLSTELFDQI